MASKEGTQNSPMYLPIEPAFTNRPNQLIRATNGKQYWHSRSVAVVAIPLYWINNRVYIPLGKRSKSMDKFPGFWGIPCGFLDWGETAAEAVRREVWEEIRLELTPDMVNDQPNLVISDPDPTENETVSMRFVIRALRVKLPRISPGEEVSEVQWLEVDQGGLWKSIPLAFNHQEIIEWALGR